MPRICSVDPVLSPQKRKNKKNLYIFSFFLNTQQLGSVINFTYAYITIMEQKETDIDSITEEHLVELLATLRVEPVKEADYEERFLFDLRERIARDAVCRPARALLWQHLLQFFGNMGLRKWAWGAGVCCAAGALTVTMLIPQPEGAPLSVASVKAPAPRTSLPDGVFSRLYSPASSDKFTCISVSGGQRTPFTQNHHALNGNVRILEVENVVVFEVEQDDFPTQAGLAPLSDAGTFSSAPLNMAE